MNTIISLWPQLVMLGAASGLTWLAARKRNAADVAITHLDSILKSVAIYKQLAIDMEKEVLRLMGIVDNLKIENKLLLEQLSQQRKARNRNHSEDLDDNGSNTY